MRVVASPAHALGAAGPVVLGDLEGEPLLFTRSGCAYRGLFEGRLTAAGVSPRDVLDFDSVEAIKRCVEAGMGIDWQNLLSPRGFVVLPRRWVVEQTFS